MKHTITFFSFVLLTVMFSLQGQMHAEADGLNWNTNQTPVQYLDQIVQKDYLAQTGVTTYNAEAPFEETYDETMYDAHLESLGIRLHPGTGFIPESKSSPSSLNNWNHCKSLVYRTLKSLPQAPVRTLKNLTLYFSDEGRRGLGGGSTIILRCQNVTDMELVGVLVHEMGHIMDTGVLNGTLWAGESEFKDGSNPVYKDDVSLDFYRISFENETKLRLDASGLDFVSGYAMTDPYEDFAESYAYYILHGNEFRQLMAINSELNQKYEYLKTRIFNGNEYINGDDSRQVEPFERHYDVTVLPYDMKKFFVI